MGSALELPSPLLLALPHLHPPRYPEDDFLSQPPSRSLGAAGSRDPSSSCLARVQASRAGRPPGARLLPQQRGLHYFLFSCSYCFALLL